MVDINDLYHKITNNKIYVDLKNYELKENNFKKDDIFNDMTLSHIKKTNKDENITNLDINYEFKKKQNIKYKPESNNKITYIENSLLNELSKITLLDINEIKEKIKEFTNSSISVDYLKSLSRSYKKLRININNILVQNLDKHLFNELFLIICKTFDFNIIIINDYRHLQRVYHQINVC